MMLSGEDSTYDIDMIWCYLPQIATFNFEFSACNQGFALHTFATQKVIVLMKIWWLHVWNVHIFTNFGWKNIIRMSESCCTHLWCDLRKPVTWHKIDILSYWYYVKVWIIFSFWTFLLGSSLILVSKVTNIQRL